MIMIVPHLGAGSIRFGMTRAEVEQIVGEQPRRMRLSSFDLSDIDFFAGFAICYDANDRCCAIEFSKGISQVAYDDYELFEHPAHEVRDWALGRDPDLQNEDGFISTALGLSMYAPSIDEPDLDEEERREPAQSFLAFRPGYYEEEQARIAAAGLIPEGSPK